MKVRKIGDKWGSDAPNMYYDLLKPHQVSVGYFTEPNQMPELGDLVIVAHGHTAKAIIKVNSLTLKSQDWLKEALDSYSVHEDEHIKVIRGAWFGLDTSDQFQYPTQTGNHEAHGEYAEKAKSLYKEYSER